MKISKNILLLTGGLAAGIGLSYLITCNQPMRKPAVRITDLRKTVEKNEAGLLQETNLINETATKTAYNLTKSKERLKQTGERKDVLYKTLKEVVVSNAPDTVSIVRIAPSLLSVVAESDSLFRQVVQQQDTLLKIKDTLIAVHQSAYVSLRTSFDQSLQQQEGLLQLNRQLSTDLKKQRRKTRLIAAASVLVTGLVAGYLVSR